jgi:hypothetical protein
MEVRKERTNWRDSGIEKIHSKYNFAYPCENVDFLMVEYDKSSPVAIIDYRKKKKAKIVHSNSIFDLCENRNNPIPYFITSYTIYDSELKDFEVVAVNKVAKERMNLKGPVNEARYVEFMYDLREYSVPGRKKQGKEVSRELNKNFIINEDDWDNQALSNRHRDWGYDCPAVDLDFIVVNKGKIAALVEYKHNDSSALPSKFKHHPTGITLSSLAKEFGLKIPLLFCYYNDDYSRFTLYPISNSSLEHEPYFGRKLSQKEYFEFLKKL